MTRCSCARSSIVAALLLSLAPLHVASAQERKPPDPTPAKVPAALTIEQRREIARKAAHFEANYRNRVARVQRLLEVYRAKGDETHVTELQRLKEKLDLRRQHAMQGFRERLGDAGFKRYEQQVNGGARRKLDPERRKQKETERPAPEPTPPERTPPDRPGEETNKEKPPGGGARGGAA